MQTIPFSEARAHLAEALREVAASQEPVMISRRGQAAGVLMPIAKYRQLCGTDGTNARFTAQLSKWRAQHAQPEQGEDFSPPDRDQSDGREFSW